MTVRLRGASLVDLNSEHCAMPIPPEPESLLPYVDISLDQEILDVAQR